MEQKDIPTLKMDKVPLTESPTAIMDPPKKGQSLDKKRVERIAQIAMLLGAVVLIYLIVSLLSSDLFDLYSERLRPFVQQYWPNMIAVVVVFILGYVLYTLRGYQKIWFGIAEMALAIGLAWYAINKAVSGSVSDAIVFLFGALYLAGRSWINISSRIHALHIDPSDEE